MTVTEARWGWFTDVEGYEISDQLPDVIREEIAPMAGVHLPSRAMRYVEMVPGEWIDEIRAWTEENLDQIVSSKDLFWGAIYYFYDEGILYFWSWLYKRLTLFDQAHEGKLAWHATQPDEIVRNVWMRQDNVIGDRMRKETGDE